MAADRSRVKALFFELSELPPSEQRAALEARASDDPEVFAEVAALLDFHDDTPLLAQAAPSPDVPDPLGLVGLVLDDRYAVDRFVAEGGFAFVYRGRDTRDDRPVALKVFKEADPTHRDRLERAFLREAELLADLSGALPVLVHTHGLGRCVTGSGADLLFLVLEWLDGAPLEVEPGGRTAGEVAALLGPVAQTLAALHDRGIAHRDIKPDNVFVQHDGRVRLLDLGIAKVAHDRARGFASTATASSAFTMKYAAPEQVRNQATGPWTDVYGLALTAVELLAGRHPYDELGTLETLMAVADPTRRPTPGSTGAQVAPELEALFEQALAADPQSRPSIGEFWSALTQLG